MEPSSKQALISRLNNIYLYFILLLNSNKKLKYLLIFLFLTALVFLSYYYQYNNQYWKYDPPRDGWYRCVDDIKEGKLYEFTEGGYIECFQAPLLFYFMHFIDLFSGNDFNNFLFLSAIITIILNSLSLFIICRISKKEIKNYNYKTLIFLVSLFIILITSQVYGLRQHNTIYDVKFSTFFLLLGFYILSYSNFKYKEFLSAIPFSMALFTKVMNLFFIVFIVGYYFFNIYKTNKSLKEIFVKSVYFSLPFLIFFIIFLILTPNFVKVITAYQYVGAFNERSIYQDSTAYLSNLSWEAILVFLVILLSGYYFFRNRDIFSFVSLFGFLSIPLVSLIASHDISVNPAYYRYLYPILPFFVISTTKYLFDKTRTIEKLILLFLLIFILYLPLNIIFNTHYITSLDKALSYPLSFVPKQEGRILTDYDRFSWYGNEVYDDSKFDQPFRIGFYDNAGAVALEKAGLVNISEWEKKDKEKLNIYKERLFNKEYSLISMAFMHDLSNVYQIIKRNDSELVVYELDYFPSFIIPTLEKIERHATGIFFNKLEDYNQVRKDTLDYYNKNFDAICRKSRFVANEVLYILNQYPDSYGNFLPFDKYCNSNFDFFVRYSNQLLGNKPKINDLITILSLFGIVSLLIFRNKFNFYILSILILTLLIIIVIVYLRNEPTCGINKISWAPHLNVKFPDGKEICCQDYNKNKQCDYFELFETKECFTVLQNNIKVPLGITCSKENDCIPKLNKINKFYPNIIKEKLNESKLSCEPSYYAFKSFLGYCKETADCNFNYKSEIERELIKDSFKCKFNICTILKGAL